MSSAVSAPRAGTPPAPAWSDPAYYAAPRLPARLATLAASGRDVGSAGKVGVLDLAFEAASGPTRLVRHYHRLPLYAVGALHVDTGWPEMAFVYAMQAGEGVVQGDRYRVDVACGPGAAVHLTTQASTKLFGMNDGYASQVLNVSVGAGAFVEYLPDPVVPFAGARFYQHARIDVHEDATLVFGEVLLPGRVARGEEHAYRFYRADTEVHAPGGELLFGDRLELEPHAGGLRSLACLGPYDVLATLYAVTRREPARRLVERARGVLGGAREVLGGATELPNGAGAIVRIAGRRGVPVTTAMRAAWSAWREMLAGVSAPDVRKP